MLVHCALPAWSAPTCWMPLPYRPSGHYPRPDVAASRSRSRSRSHPALLSPYRLAQPDPAIDARDDRLDRLSPAGTEPGVQDRRASARTAKTGQVTMVRSGRISTRALHTGHDGASSIHCLSRIVAIPRQFRAVGSASSCAQERWLSFLARSEGTGAKQMPRFQENGSLSRPALAGLRARLEDMAAGGLGDSHQPGMSWHARYLMLSTGVQNRRRRHCGSALVRTDGLLAQECQWVIACRDQSRTGHSMSPSDR